MLTEETQELFANCLVLLVEAAAQNSAADLLTDKAAAARLDVAIAKLKNPYAKDVPDLVLQVLSVEPDSAYAYTVWGLALAKEGRFDRSLMAFDTAIDLDEGFLLAVCGKILLLSVTKKGQGLPEEVALLRRQLSNCYNEFAKVFVQILGSLGPPSENETRFVNIGGGPNFDHWHWRNLESVPSDSNPNPIRFTPDSDFPLADDSVELVYSSHCLEHLDDPTVARALSEARRILRPDGALLIKLPDFDRVLDDWRRQDPSLISAPVWNIESLLPMWDARGVADTLDNRAAVIFCGFWNDAYGDENSLFSGDGKQSDDAYLGPPVMAAEALRDLAGRAQPHEIAATLRQHVLDTEPTYTFNHQNAWSRAEFEAVLAEAGFDVLSFEQDKIVARYRWVPLIHDMDHMSFYCLAVPAMDRHGA